MCWNVRLVRVTTGVEDAGALGRTAHASAWTAGRARPAAARRASAVTAMPGRTAIHARRTGMDRAKRPATKTSTALGMAGEWYMVSLLTFILLHVWRLCVLECAFSACDNGC